MSPHGGGTPEERARVNIDAALEEAGWAVQDRDLMNLAAARGVAVREFKLARGHGYADYLLFVDGKAVGVLEAKPEGHTLSGVEPQVTKYAAGLPKNLKPPVRPLPFLYLSTGTKTRFTNLLDLHPKSRSIFQIHTPETIAEWLSADTLDAWVKALQAEGIGYSTGADDTRPSTLRTRISAMPSLDKGYAGQYPNQVEAIVNLERSLRHDKPRALIQMATGSGKTRMAVTSIYRLIKLGGARRVLFLVDRANLGEQAETEFEAFRTPDDNRKFTELYNVQRLTTNTLGASTKVAITTIQRLYSILKGEPELDPDLEEAGAQLTPAGAPPHAPLPVAYNPTVPPETFDVIFIDECHRSIYSLWGQVLEYFDAYLIGLTATPAKHTFGFEGGAGETVRRRLLHECDVHTLLRLPTGIFYAQGVKANVLFFDRKPGAKAAWTKKLWVYDLRTNMHFTLKENPMTRKHLDDFVGLYRPGERQKRKATWSASKPEGRFRAYDYDELLARDKVRLDLTWLRDESLEDSSSLPDPHVLAQEIADDLRSALGQIEDILGDLQQRVRP